MGGLSGELAALPETGVNRPATSVVIPLIRAGEQRTASTTGVSAETHACDGFAAAWAAKITMLRSNPLGDLMFAVRRIRRCVPYLHYYSEVFRLLVVAALAGACTRHRPAISSCRPCPTRGTACITGSCQHDGSLVAEVPPYEVRHSALELFVAPRRSALESAA